MPRTAPQSTARIFAIPLVLLIASIAGLVFGLLGEGGWDIAAWAALGLPVLIGLTVLATARH